MLAQSTLDRADLEVIFRKHATLLAPRVAQAQTPVAAQSGQPTEAQSASAVSKDATPSPSTIIPVELSSLYLSLDGFTSFLLSTDNSVFSDQHGRVWQDMKHPLSDYFISSSHNTYLVGHQLVGMSTIEGYIRALLHSCRSVESGFFSFLLLIHCGETEL